MAASSEHAVAERGTETVLVVEDDPVVRQSTVRMLTGAGYRVIAAGNGSEALARVAEEKGTVHLFVTDVIAAENHLLE